jgi:hypothetical protein
MNARSLIICTTLVISACVPKSEFEAAKRVNDELNAKIEELQMENSQLKTQLERLQGEGEQLKSKLAEKPKLPVTMSLRKALTGPGYVAIFQTTVKARVPVLATVKSTALGTSKRFELHLDPVGQTELGHLEGAVIEPGDVIILENTNFSPAAFTLPKN